MTFKCVIQETFEIAADSLVGPGGRRHHHGDTIDKLPMLFVGPAFYKGTEQLDRHTRAKRCAGHCHSPGVGPMTGARELRVYASARVASTLHSPPPAAAKYRNTKQ